MHSSSSNHASIQIVPSSSEDQRIEVSIERHDGESIVALKHSTWTDGLGWCAQKTLKLDGDQLESLHHALTVARHRIKHQLAESGHELKSAKVIQLPTFA